MTPIDKVAVALPREARYTPTDKLNHDCWALWAWREAAPLSGLPVPV